MKVKSLSRARHLATPWTAAYQAPLSLDFLGKSTGVGCHCLLRKVGGQGVNSSQTEHYKAGSRIPERLEDGAACCKLKARSYTFLRKRDIHQSDSWICYIKLTKEAYFRCACKSKSLGPHCECMHLHSVMSDSFVTPKDCRC